MSSQTPISITESPVGYPCSSLIDDSNNDSANNDGINDCINNNDDGDR